jgi:hypothetical protein
MDSHRKNLGPHVDVVIGSISSGYVGPLVGHFGNMHISSNPTVSPPTTQTSETLVQPSYLHSMQSTQLNNPQQPVGKNKNKNKNSNNEH